MNAPAPGLGAFAFLLACLLGALVCGIFAAARFRVAGRPEPLATVAALSLNALLLTQWPQIAPAFKDRWSLTAFVLVLALSSATSLLAFVLPIAAKIDRRK
ncbi:hypothetical protein ACFSR9_13325 [Deinococcus taklimakanensis]|uniref:Uncharacterized protein n=1 Tax=Deinococcus taklimakanensis TaxID=536443 RepID=A0ABW5P5D2_9DEIO